MSHPGQIVTFYSYKGGVGRTMALANIAWILASNGKRVLAIDWDLESPGLHSYFRPFLADPELSSSEGVIDLLIDFTAEQMRPAANAENLPGINVLRYAVSLEWNFPASGTVDFIPAGRQGRSYPARANSFNWDVFYERLGGGVFLETIKDRLRSEYDYVLIDSRTGVSDSAGICTIQMPDILVICFALNRQNIEGAAAVARSVSEQRGFQEVRILPVPMRIEMAERAALARAQEMANERLGPFLHPVDSLWEIAVPYIPFYSYVESLSVFSDNSSSPVSLLASLERLTARLTDGEVTRLVPVSELERRRVLGLYGLPG